MPLIIATTSTGSGIQYDLADGDSLYVLAGASVVSTANVAIRGVGSSHTVRVLGNVYGAGDDGIQLGDAATDSHLLVEVLAGASVGGRDDGIQMLGMATQVRNHGTIFGNYGVSFFGDSATSATLFNDGSITAANVGLYVTSNVNISAFNIGTISGDGASVSTSGGYDSIVNRGQLIGDVLLASGNDTFDNRGGRLEGDARLGEGSDTFFAGAGAETVFGGGDEDTLDFRSSAGVTVWLTNAAPNTGVAAGDRYYDFETVQGSEVGRDRVTGDQNVNTLFGNGGNDWLSGAGGADWLIGGAGQDNLQGGRGNDIFVINTWLERGDVVTDFSNTAGNNDHFQIGSHFASGLVAGAITAGQFRKRADNHAQDADDRFIFRTTDTTLWFDEDGNGAGGPVMLANLQAGATMNFHDIIIV